VTRILWIGDLGPTGFGTVTADAIKALLARGEDVRLFQFREELLAGVPDFLEGRTVSVSRPQTWMTSEEIASDIDRMREGLRGLFTGASYDDDWAPEAVIIHSDPAAILGAELMDILPDGLPAYHYVAIEGVGLPPLWAAIWQRIQPIAMANSGAAEIERLMGVAPPMVYHGVDAEVFHPATARNPIIWEDKVITSRADAKRAFGLDPKLTLILRCDANAPRKAYGPFLRSMAAVLDRNPKTMLLINARVQGYGGNFDEMRSHFPPHIGARMLVPWRYVGLERTALAVLYNAADIYASNSSEGFGLTIAEAAACGVACVGLDFTSVPEVIGPAGIVVPVRQPLTENIYAHFWGVADERAFAVAVDTLVRDRSMRWKLAGKGPEHVRSMFTWAQAAEGFAAVIAQREAIAA
jgi:glycosyltransferase involved in cell wall biosynthesis